MYPKETKLLLAFLLISVLLGVLLAGFLYSLVRQGAAYRRLKQKLFASQASTEERERQRIGSGLHDEVCTLLVAARQELAAVALTDPDWRRRVDACDQLVKEGLERARSLAHHLRPALLEQVGLRSSLEVFIDSLPPAFGRQVCLRYRVKTPLPEDLELNLYRIVQELLQNALKHAACRHLLIRIEEEKGRLCFHYLDDGRGYSYDPYRTLPGHGLYSVQSRVGLLGGQLRIQTAPGEGTAYFFEIPVEGLEG